MKILRRYLLKQHVWPFLFAVSALTSFELLRQIARKLQDLLGKGLPWTVLLEFFALTIPFLIAITLSMSVLVAVLYTVSRMAGDHEITAMRAGGVSIGQIVRPLLLAATAVAIISFLFSDQVLPRTNHRLRALMSDIIRTKPTFSLKEHVINEVQKGRTALWAAQIDQSTYSMQDVTLYQLEEQSRKRIIYADSGSLLFTPNQEDLQLTLFDGSIHEFDRDDPQMFQQTGFGQQIVIVRGVGSEFVRRENDDYRGDRERGVCQLEEVVRTASREAEVNTLKADVAELNGLRELVGLPTTMADTDVPMPRRSIYCIALLWLGDVIGIKDLAAQTITPDSIRGGFLERLAQPVQRPLTSAVPRQRAAEVRALRDRVRSAEARAAAYKVEYHKKYSIAAACIVFVLVGIPLAFRFPGGGLGLVLGAGMIVFLIYYIGLIGGETLADRRILPPFLAMWISNILMAVGGAFAVWRMSRAGTVSRRSAPVQGVASAAREPIPT